MKILKKSQALYVVPGSEFFQTPGSFTWTPPREDVTSICVVCVGAGGGGIYPLNDAHQPGCGGGALSYSNDIAVEYGVTYTVVVGAGGGLAGENGGDSSFSHPVDGFIVMAKGGKGTAYGASCPGGQASEGVGDVKYSGGDGHASEYSASGGGGAAGYSGNGGNGGYYPDHAPTAGSGGGGGGGGADLSHDYSTKASGGGGVGLLGEGASGAAGANASLFPTRGGAGSGGTTTDPLELPYSPGGSFGGGAGGVWYSYLSPLLPYGGGGGVRIMWGEGRAFPSTETEGY